MPYHNSASTALLRSLIGSPRARAQVERHVYPEPNSGCWLWNGSMTNNGYGLASVGGSPGKARNIVAHRAVWFIMRGDVPDGLVLDHLCRNRGCVNPDHLEIVTQKENVARGVGAPKITADGRCGRCGSDRIKPRLRNGKQMCWTCPPCDVRRVLAARKRTGRRWRPPKKSIQPGDDP